ncbi:hypothetical protein BDP27DRAFT_1449817 [Rhodocollybia butyracea]|uniref:DUF6534 domain-containing protein n=1 Tax=Rhodocollybia butyracea TaxID=206335 RepID=A0A9P5PPT6_9AGAR|nr:hypothetical protein BDP27DRAFT_1449817 [Rhodocollybia butyracea]
MSAFEVTFGSNLIGSWLTAALYGLTTAQTYTFFNNRYGNSTSLKMLVFSLWVLDTLHTVVVFHIIYHYLISSAFNAPAFLLPVWSLPASVVVNAFVVAICQIYFTWVIYKLCKKTWLRITLTMFIMAFIILHFGWGIATAVIMMLQKTLADYQTKQFVAFLPYTITQLPVDFALAASLCILLFKKRTAFQRTETLINTLIMYAVNRCILTSAVALVEVLAVGIAPDSFWFIAAEYILGQLYVNSLLATLNGRDSVKDSSSRGDATLSSGGFNAIPLDNIHHHPVALELQNASESKSRNFGSDNIFDMPDRLEGGVKIRGSGSFPGAR